MRKEALNYLLILVGALLYAVGTVFFIFPSSLLLGGTSGISVILNEWLPFSPGTIMAIINVMLIVLAFVVLGKSMGIKTLVGSLLTTAAITGGEYLFALTQPVISNRFLSAVAGAAIIAVASGVMFFVGASSGGTDIIALIVKKYSKINIGKALLITDCLIVIVGGTVSGLSIGLASGLGLLVKTLGIDGVIWLINRIRSVKEQREQVNRE